MMTVYHVVTDRPMYVGQQIVFDDDHRSGVYSRVMAKMPEVEAIYAHPEQYDADQLEHHTRVALRELALEQVRREKYPDLPSRMGCLYASQTLEEAEKWAGLFVQWGRPTYHIVRLSVDTWFTGDAWNCFAATTSLQENLKLAERYWQNLPNLQGEPPMQELLVAGCVTVEEIVKEINANL